MYARTVIEQIDLWTIHTHFVLSYQNIAPPVLIFYATPWYLLHIVRLPLPDPDENYTGLTHCQFIHQDDNYFQIYSMKSK